MAKVSVIISTYNRKELLKRAVKSVLDQSMPDFELIVVDDCSTEDVAKLVTSFGDPRIRYLKTEKNSGHDALPKNLGIRHATSDLVTFLDDDDLYRRDALKILTTYMKESDADVVYGDYLIDGKPGWSLDFNPNTLSKMNFIAMCVALCKRSALLKVGGFDQEIPKFKDWNLWIRLQKNGARFLHVPIIVTEVHETKGGISETVKIDRGEDGRYLPTFFNPADCKIYPDNTILGPRKPLRIAVYTLTMNRFEYTKRMAKALEERAGYPFDWFVIDQGSKDGTQDWIKKLTRDIPSPTGGRELWREKLRYRLYEENVGLAKGWNNIVSFIKSEGEYDILIKVDNDAEMLTQDWLKAMVDIYERNRRLVLSPYVEGLENTPGGVLRQRASGDSPYMLINDHVLGYVPHVGGIVYATPISIWDEFTFDESFEGNKDVLLSNYARQTGYSLFYMEEFTVWHIDGTSGQKVKFPEYYKK